MECLCTTPEALPVSVSKEKDSLTQGCLRGQEAWNSAFAGCVNQLEEVGALCQISPKAYKVDKGNKDS